VGGSDELLRPSSHYMVPARGHKIDLQVTLEGVSPELRNVVGELVQLFIKVRVDDFARRAAEGSGRNKVVRVGCARCRIRAGKRVVKLLRGVVADAAGKSRGAQRGKIATPLRQ